LETDLIRDDTVVLTGPRMTRRARRVQRRVVEAFEAGNHRVLQRRRITPEELLEIKRHAEENGRLGEEFVLNHERRALRRAGRQDLADGVTWISQESVSEGYDILSYELDGEQKWIEVKSTSGLSRTFEMSDYEWRTCCAAGERYYIYRVTNVRTAPSIERVRNPSRLERDGQVARSALGWKVTLL
jgi:hypothetical protein